MRTTLEDIRDKIKGTAAEKLNPHLFAELAKKPSKYRNTPTEVDGIRFDSKKEAKRYKELRLLLKRGIIGQLARQVEYELNAGGTHSLIYMADFVYVDAATGVTIVEDVKSKGTSTPLFRKKKKLMKRLFNIEVRIL